MLDVSPRATTITTAGVGLAATVVVGMVARTGLDLGAIYPIKAAVGFAAIMAIAILNVAAHHPFPRFGLANQITTVRVALLALMAGLLGEPRLPMVPAAATAVSLLMAILDGVDGWVARRTRMSSAFGARFDMETDALLILVLAAMAWQYGKAGAWILMAGLLRYIFVAAAGLFPWIGEPLAPSPRGRIICVVQIVTLGLCIAPAIESPASAAIAAVGLLALTYSFLVDTVWLWRRR